jgi:hypothetical protein
VHHDDRNAIGCHEFGAAIIAVACQEVSIFYRPGLQTPAVALAPAVARINAARQWVVHADITVLPFVRLFM